jgi:hypothetical protein
MQQQSMTQLAQQAPQKSPSTMVSA